MGRQKSTSYFIWITSGWEVKQQNRCRSIKWFVPYEDYFSHYYTRGILNNILPLLCTTICLIYVPSTTHSYSIICENFLHFLWDFPTSFGKLRYISYKKCWLTIYLWSNRMFSNIRQFTCFNLENNSTFIVFLKKFRYQFIMTIQSARCNNSHCLPIQVSLLSPYFLFANTTYGSAPSAMPINLTYVKPWRVLGVTFGSKIESDFEPLGTYVNWFVVSTPVILVCFYTTLLGRNGGFSFLFWWDVFLAPFYSHQA